jgi:hypothetical protein
LGGEWSLLLWWNQDTWTDRQFKDQPVRHRLPTRRSRQHFFANRAILAIRNDQLDPINELPGDSKTYYAANAAFENGSTTPTDDVTTEFLQSVHLPGLPPHLLRLKVGAPVMLLRNLYGLGWTG